MSELQTIVPKTDRSFLADGRKIAPEDPKQRKLMLGSLCLLLLALGFVLWHNREFWFPETAETDSESPVQVTSDPKVAATKQPPAVMKPASPAKAKMRATARPKASPVSVAPGQASTDSTPPAPVAITARTFLPPLEVEVIAGDRHRTIRPGSGSVRVDLQSGTPTQPNGDVAGGGDTETAAKVTTDATDRVQMSTDASEIVARPVKPNYPLLARQMKVQGSVILQALIGKDGVIQNLRVVSGPHILASAAQDAVRQWHFKPHLQGSDAVETEAKITVNFTISTN
jgi:protein TonB